MQRHLHGARRPVTRIMLFSIGAVATFGGIAAALNYYSIIPIHRLGGEKRLVFRLDAPYGSVDLRSGAGPNDAATIELLADEADARSPQWSYGMHNGNVGMLRIGIGTDEGMVSKPPIAMWDTRSGFSPAVATAPEPDWAPPCPSSFFSFSTPVIPFGSGFPQRFHSLSTDAGTKVESAARAGTRITLSKDLPIDFAADLGFGESFLDLTGLPITDASIETGASRTRICCNSVNPAQLRNCTVHAGLGQCTFSGISNLNADHFTFHGAVGSYHLGCEGTLTHNLDAAIDIGMGMCTVTIPPTAGRVQVFFEEGLLSSYTFSGLAERRPGYASSPGFDMSKSPVLTLHLSSGVGKISVSYH